MVRTIGIPLVKLIRWISIHASKNEKLSWQTFELKKYNLSNIYNCGRQRPCACPASGKVLWALQLRKTSKTDLKLMKNQSFLSQINGFPLIFWWELGPLSVKQVAADMLTAGQVAPQSQFEESANDRGSRSWGGIQNQSTSTGPLVVYPEPSCFSQAKNTTILESRFTSDILSILLFAQKSW